MKPKKIKKVKGWVTRRRGFAWTFAYGRNMKLVWDTCLPKGQKVYPAVLHIEM